MAKEMKSNKPAPSMKDTDMIPQHKRMAMGLPVNGMKAGKSGKSTKK